MPIQTVMAKAKSAVEFMYDKTAIIKRHVPIVKPNGADGMDWIDQHVNVPCRTSSVTLRNVVQDDTNKIESDEKLFMSSDYPVFPGDIFIVNGVKYESTQKPFVYVSHQEVLLLFKGYA